MKIDIVIKNGHVIDPSRNKNVIEDVGVLGRRIVDITGKEYKATKVIDGTGCYVFPGLIDFHSHLFYSQNISVYPDWMIPTGVTTAVDAGSAGCANYEAFQRSIINNCQLKIKSFLNIYGGGMTAENIMENYDLKLIRPDDIRRIYDKFPNDIIGLKVRVSKNLIPDLKILDETINLAEKLGLKVCVHTTNPAGSVDYIADSLRAGDIWAHMYQGQGETILDNNGKIRESIKKARERGVIFDVANGRWHLDFDVVKKSLKEGFTPDIISTDQTLEKINYMVHAKNLPMVMSKFLMLGYSLYDTVKAVTETPAKILGMENEIGTLSSGGIADISIFRKIDINIKHSDYKNNIMEGKDLLVPMMTILDGEIAYCRTEFNL